MPIIYRILLIALGLTLSQADAAPLPDCRLVVQQLNSQLASPVAVQPLAQTLSTLNATGRLPERFVTKQQARAAGWQPGSDLWSVPALQGKSMGGDRFGNREKQLPPAQYTEADVDYRGGKRGAKRLVFSRSQQFISVDHYRTFIEVSPCR